MAKGQYLSSHQQSIVKRYYRHQDAIYVTKVQELLGDIAMATEEKALAKLWKRAEETLAKLAVEPETIAKIVPTRNLQALGKLVGELTRA